MHLLIAMREKIVKRDEEIRLKDHRIENLEITMKEQEERFKNGLFFVPFPVISCCTHYLALLD